jgi:TRAP-type C4-dicarboxylate transport system permease small subunit
MINGIERILKKVDKAFEWGSALILGSMSILIFLQVFFRKVVVQPLAWSEELASFLFIWMTFIAGYVGARRGSHIGVSLIQDLCPTGVKKIMQFLSMLISSVFFGVIVYYCLKLWPKLMSQISPAIGIPMAFVYLGMIIGSAFMSIWYLISACNNLVPNGKGDIL